MPPKRTRKSSLKSLTLSNDSKQKASLRTSMKSLKLEEISSGVHSQGNETLDYEPEHREEESSHKLEAMLSRTSLLLLDYLQFKAARSIQRFVRGWLDRSRYKRLKWASIIIQKEWRRFHACRLYYRKLEALVQQRIEEHYFKSAQKIQALWRGWWVREHIHDHTKLVRLQLLAGEDLLHCVAFKLHHLLRTHQIPGVYSLRNSSAFSKVEALLASMTFKTCTERVRKAHDFRQQQIKEGRKQFEKSAHGTRVPFSGPNLHNSCRVKCLPLYNEKDADRKMNKILRMYEEAANRQDPRLRNTKLKSKFSQQYRGICRPEPSTFCGDIVRSMKKWQIISDGNFEVDPNIFQHPENVEHFLKEIKSWWSLLHGNCHCRPADVKEMAEREEGSSNKNKTSLK
ncbi:uncharacterized protein LOC133329349 [Musca vetustissima]|uniref:uncharacterized protein LOC133329349 n=1 Tax=Musca vetustissima TaxID=27455 RepID=UPI002AB65AD7|nr:uncharacterized protein LOC133329349 [Musca vetustissima]